MLRKERNKCKCFNGEEKVGGAGTVGEGNEACPNTSTEQQVAVLGDKAGHVGWTKWLTLSNDKIRDWAFEEGSDMIKSKF